MPRKYSKKKCLKSNNLCFGNRLNRDDKLIYGFS